MKIGVQMYTVRDYCKNEKEIEATLRRIKAMGFDLIQIMSLNLKNSTGYGLLTG